MRSLCSTFGFVALMLLALIAADHNAFPAEQHRPPNIVFILADDLGCAELGCYGHGFNETPHLNRLAGDGMRFTQAYAAAPVCSPYRAALLTGQHPARIGILDYLRPNSANALSTDHVALPETLQRHEAYRRLVKRVDEFDARDKQCYPLVFQSHKEFRKHIAKLRKHLYKDDAHYRELLFATHRATRAIDTFLIALQPEVARLPDSRKARELELLRQRFQNDPRFQKVIARRNEAQQKLETAFPQLFLTDRQIAELRREHRTTVENDPEFRKLINERAAAWRAQQDYLFDHGRQLTELQQKLTETEASAPAKQAP